MAIDSGLYRRLLPIGNPLGGPFIAFSQHSARPSKMISEEYWRSEAAAVLKGRLRLFSDKMREFSFPPDWTSNALTGSSAIPRGLHWSQIDPLGRPGDDIKGYWELSRF